MCASSLCGSSLVQVMAHHLSTPSLYTNHWWLIVSWNLLQWNYNLLHRYTGLHQIFLFFVPQCSIPSSSVHDVYAFHCQDLWQFPLHDIYDLYQRTVIIILYEICYDKHVLQYFVFCHFRNSETLQKPEKICPFRFGIKFRKGEYFYDFQKVEVIFELLENYLLKLLLVYILLLAHCGLMTPYGDIDLGDIV